MNMTAYKTTGAFIAAIRKLFRVELRVSGAENLPDRPTIFAANHFTRMETVLIPYALYYSARRPVRSLAMHALFSGLSGRYMRSVGVMSVRDPHRNRTIIRELMTKASDWVIYPEGGLIKNKKTVARGKLQLSHPKRQGPPHTGAAMLALKAEIAKHRFLRACQQEDRERLRYYHDVYGLTRPEEICEEPIVVVPLTVTLYPLRPEPNPISRLAKRLKPNLDPRVEEELRVEGSVLFGQGEVSIHFGEPIEVTAHLDTPTELARRVVGMFSEERRGDLMLRRQATKLTSECMRRVYANTEINFDHLFCYGLRCAREDRVRAADFHRSLYLAARELSGTEGLRLHPALENGIASLVSGETYAPLESVAEMAVRQGIVKREAGHYVIDHEALKRQHDFHEVRLVNTVQVLANELEPIRPATRALSRCINRAPERTRKTAARALREDDHEDFQRDYETWYDPELSKTLDVASPFFLKRPRAEIGVILVHGYLSSPAQVRPLAEHLHEHGCAVYGVRLPGHGTAPEQLTEVTWQDWMRALFRAHGMMRHQTPRVVVGGFSLGGILALMLAASRPETVDGVFSINAPLRLRDLRAPLVPAIVRWDGWMQRLRLRSGHLRRAGHHTETPELNYTRDYLLGVRELRRAIASCRRHLQQVTSP
ncbi:MAG: alpha/beta fold hydrolase, partial [Planctomycetota bacterium]